MIKEQILSENEVWELVQKLQGIQKSKPFSLYEMSFHAPTYEVFVPYKIILN